MFFGKKQPSFFPPVGRPFHLARAGFPILPATAPGGTRARGSVLAGQTGENPDACQARFRDGDAAWVTNDE